MKIRTFLFVMITIMISSSLIAQDALKKGSYSLSGSITINSSENNSDDFKTESFDIYFTPGISYFFMDDFAAGIELSFGYLESTHKVNDRSFKYIDRPFSISPHARYYFSQFSLNPFVEAGAFYTGFLGDDFDMKGFSIASGINLFLSDNAALEPFIQYRKRYIDQGDQKSSEIMVGLRISYFIVE